MKLLVIVKGGVVQQVRCDRVMRVSVTVLDYDDIAAGASCRIGDTHVDADLADDAIDAAVKRVYPFQEL
jgi:hypothetical protein